MTRAVLAIVVCLMASSASADDKVKVFVFAESNPAVSNYVPAALADSVVDLKYSLRIIEVWHNYVSKKREDANVFAQIMGREERDGEFHVRAHVTTRDGRTVDLTGTSAHQWKKATDDLAHQIVAWAKAR